MRSLVGRSLAILVIAISVFAMRTSRLAAACAPGIVTSPQGNNTSFDPSTSADGRHTAFWSAANDLVPGDTNNREDVFVVDRLTCAIERVSVSTAGVQGNNTSSFPSISDTGRYVAFMSTATNLVANDTNSAPDIFVRDRQTNSTVRASVTSAGAQAAGALGSVRPDMSGNGQFVAFLSFATNLVAGDTNGTADVFVRDLVNNVTERVSVATGGTQGIDGDSQYDKPAISADGRYVAFASTMTNLVAGDTNVARDIFRRDRQTGTTVRVSVSTAGDQTPTSQDSTSPAISADGRYIAFDSFATNLVPDDTNFNYDVFVRDMAAGTTTRVSLINQGGQPEAFAWAQSVAPSISGDGRYVAFTSGAEDLVLGDNNGWNDVFIHDRTTGITRRVSTSFNGLQGDFHSAFVDLSADGTVVTYSSFASTLVPGDDNYADDVFIAEWRLVSAPPNVNLMRNGTFAGGLSRWLEFATPDMTHIVSNVTGGVYQYYRVPPPPGTPGQAVVFQNTTAQLLPGAPIVATFDLGNSSSARKRVSVLVHDANFSDLHVCTLWLDAGAPMRTYTMRTHTTRAWADATISFYAATAGSDGGFYRVDNVSLMYAPAEAGDRTDCVDPTAPVPPGGAASANLIANGTFGAGMASWGLFGQIVAQVAGGVFEFYRSPGTPAGVVLQGTGQAMVAGEILTASFELGNSSVVRKRVTVIIHEGDFSDLVACTFWLPASTPLQTFTIRTFTTKAWANATFSVYPATVGAEQWIRLDNVVLQRTPAASIVGTECLEPGAAPAPWPPQASTPGGLAIASPRATGAPRVVRDGSPGRGPSGSYLDAGMPRSTADRSAGADSTRLAYWLRPGLAYVLQVSDDGVEWRTVAEIAPSDAWQRVWVDVSAVAGAVWVRIVPIDR